MGGCLRPSSPPSFAVAYWLIGLRQRIRGEPVRHRHTKNQFPRQPYKTTTDSGEAAVVYFEKNPNCLFSRENVESFGFKQLLLKQYDYRCRGIGRKHYRKLLDIKIQWETGGMTPPRYVPAKNFRSLGRVLDLHKSEDVEFKHKDHTAQPSLV